MPRWALGVEYDGGAFHGWQRVAAGVRSVQEVLEAALSSVADAPIATVCAGRTDAGVHATGQVVHFDSDAPRSARAWILGTTARLKADVAVTWCEQVDDDFNARFSARQRQYRYRLLNRQVRPAFTRQYLSWELHPLDAPAMHRAAQALVGEHDFESFRSAQCQANHARRNIHHIAVTRQGEEVTMDITGNAFLHHMVRNIMGALLEVGKGRRPETWTGELLQARNRALGGVTAPAAGLVFVGPRYSARFGLPAAHSLFSEEETTS